MSRPGLYTLASLMLEVSAAMVLGDPTGSSQGVPCNAVQGRSIHDECGSSSSWTSQCQIAYINTAEDFCLWAPPQPKSAPSDSEHTEVAWCTKSGYETRLIPDGTISWAHLVVTPEYVQVIGVGNFTLIHVPPEGFGSTSGDNDSVGGRVFTTAYDQLEQLHNWTSFVSQDQFCFRACRPSVNASAVCPRIHDVLACRRDIPKSSDVETYEGCPGDMAEKGGIRGPLVLDQNALTAPSNYLISHPAKCAVDRIVSYGEIIRRKRDVTSVLPSTSATPSLTHHRPSRPSGSSMSSVTTNVDMTITFPSFPSSIPYSTSSTSQTSQTISSTPTLPRSRSHSHFHHHPHPHPYPHSSLSTPSPSSLTNLSSIHHSFSHHSFTSPRSSSSSYHSSSPSVSSTPSPNPSPSPTGPPSSAPFPSSVTPASSPYISNGTSSAPSTSPAPFPPSVTPISSNWTSSVASTPSSLSLTSSSMYSSSPHLSPDPTSSASSSTPSSVIPPSSVSDSSFSPTPSSLASSTASSQSSEILTFPTSTTSLAPSSSSPSTNAQTQLGSQCPVRSQTPVNAGSAVYSTTSLLHLMLVAVLIIASPSVGVLA